MAWHFSGETPVYLQIISHLRADILNGKYRADQQIPPVRQLAMEAGVNPNTMQRALSVLEAEQLFVTRGTVGRFVTTDETVLSRAREILRRETTEHILVQARAAGISPEELINRIRLITAQTDPERSDPS